MTAKQLTSTSKNPSLNSAKTSSSANLGESNSALASRLDKTLMTESDPFAEREPIPSVIELAGLGVVRRDAEDPEGELDSIFDGATVYYPKTGARSWGIIRGIKSPWPDAINLIPADIYKIHMMAVKISPHDLSEQSIDRIISRTKDMMEENKKNFGGVSVYRDGVKGEGESNIMVVSDEFLDPYVASLILEEINRFVNEELVARKSEDNLDISYNQ